MLKEKKGKCQECELHFFQEWDVLEIDHKIPRALGDKDEWKNLHTTLASALPGWEDCQRW
ncbi:HNH endonuclease [Microcoleus sp. AT3-D2]|uniref:HNH endonuclease n=1 Tax=Microcoleus sp. AT3-D2 TaxID=2818612 RepID=UPI002FD04A17